jgi:hypothetical protein
MLVVTAVHTFVAEHGDELEFSAGEPIEVIERDDDFGDGWWRVSQVASLTNSRGATSKAKRVYSQRPISQSPKLPRIPNLSSNLLQCPRLYPLL